MKTTYARKSKHRHQMQNDGGHYWAHEMVRELIVSLCDSAHPHLGVLGLEIVHMAILNLTQHAATADQLSAGVVEPADKRAVQQLITFDELPEAQEILRRAVALAGLARESGHSTVMIGGAPFFMGPLERALEEVGVKALYAFSRRESVEVLDPQTGGVRKTQVFVHAGFVEAVPRG